MLPPLVEKLRSLRGEAFVHASRGISSLADWQRSAASMNTAQAFYDLEQSIGEFQAAEAALKNGIGWMLPLAEKTPFGRSLRDGHILLSAAEDSTDIARMLTTVLHALSQQGRFSNERALLHLPAIADATTDIRTRVEKLAAKLETIDVVSLSSDHAKDISAFITALHRVKPMLRSVENIAGFLSYALGYDSKRRFLVLFQNSAELRPTGGFAGSFALLDFDRGKIVRIDFPGGGSYDLQGSLRTRVRSPRALQTINPRWEFQDANWFSDFPTSAKKLMDFYEKSGGSSVDGVIAINSSFFERLLSVIGPIPMPAYQVTVSGDTFMQQTLLQVESRYDKTKNKPKAFIGDLIPRVLSRLETISDAEARILLRLVLESVAGRDIQIYSSEDAQEARLRALGASGEVFEGGGDFLQIVDANVGGNKSDRVMRMRVSETVALSKKSGADVVLRIERVHTGTPGELFFGSLNRSYLRFLVPAGAALLGARGFVPVPSVPNRPLSADPDIFASEGGDLPGSSVAPMIQGSEKGKTVFGGIIETQAGSTSVAEIRYRAPLPKSFAGTRYSLIIGRQSGSTLSEYALRIIPPAGMSFAWTKTPGASTQSGNFEWRGAPTTDLFFAAAIK